MNPEREYLQHVPNTWCPGCGNFGIIRAMRVALKKLSLPADEVCIVSGIGCSGYFPHYLGDTNTFHGIHGRTLPVATALKLTNHNLTVIAEGGDGDGYSEGGNHFIHAIRRNANLMYVVHDNRMFSLTKAQPSPTTDPGFPTKFTAMFEKGQPLPSFNPIAVAIAMGGTFIARGFSGETDHLTHLFMEGIKHRGFAFINVLQPCVAWKYKNTWQWYRKRIYKLEEDKTYDPENSTLASERSWEWEDKVPIGIFYKNPSKVPVYDDMIPAIKEKPLVSYPLKTPDMTKILKKYEL